MNIPEDKKYEGIGKAVHSLNGSLKILRNIPVKPVKFDKDIFIAEYNSLRQEILQRISQQTTITEIAITAWGLILAYALEKVHPDSYNDVYLILIYPLLAYFISFGWAFNNTRICQIGRYLRVREKQLAGEDYSFLFWENYIHKEPGSRNRQKIEIPGLRIGNKVKPGVAIFLGTQIASIGIIILILLSKEAILNIKPGLYVLICIDLLFCFLTYRKLIDSGK